MLTHAHTPTHLHTLSLLAYCRRPTYSKVKPRYTFTLLDCALERTRPKALSNTLEAVGKVRTRQLERIRQHGTLTHTHTHSYIHTHAPSWGRSLLRWRMARKTLWFTHKSEQRDQSQYEYAASKSVSASKRYSSFG